MGLFSKLFGGPEEDPRPRRSSPPPDLAFVDVETTGFDHQGHDRIVEIGIVRTDFWGEERGTFESLINPNRDVGPTHIHGITAEMVRDAPTFEALSGSVLEMLDGTYLVAHNSQFDVGFLLAEFGRADMYVGQVPSYCTMTEARRVFPDLPSKKLDHLCECFEITRERAHAALEDARATRHLLAILREEKPDIVSDAHDPVQAGEVGRKSGASPLSRSQFRERQHQTESALGGLLARLPSVETGEEGADAYAALLDEILTDRIVSDEELEDIASLAEDYGVSREAAERIHLDYLRNLIRYALADESVTTAERRDIEKVERLLGLEAHDLDALIDEVREGLHSTYERTVSASLKGKSVCFTGSLVGELDGEAITRSMAQRLADERGMVVKRGVTKSLDYLVAADPHTQSGKAEKARRYDIPILAEMEFWRKLGVKVR